MLSQQMDAIIQKETAIRQKKGQSGAAAATQIRQARQHKENTNYGNILDAQIEKANSYSATLMKQHAKLKTRLEKLEENPTYEAELKQNIQLAAAKIDALRMRNKETEVR